MVSWIKLKKSNETKELMKNPAAFMLLTQIAIRAKRTNSLSVENLDIGEALIGDYLKIGLTEQLYRTAKKNLEKWGFSTFKATNKGTIAKIINTKIYDINNEQDNEQDNEQITIKQRSDNDQITTNKNVKKDKNEKKEDLCPFDEVLKLYHKELPTLAEVKKLTPVRKSQLRARWNESEKTRTLPWWHDFFVHISKSAFLMGGNNRQWKADLEWITKQANFIKIIEGKYHQ